MFAFYFHKIICKLRCEICYDDELVSKGQGGGAFLRLCDSMYWCIGYVLVQKIALFIVDDEPAGKT